MSHLFNGQEEDDYCHVEKEPKDRDRYEVAHWYAVHLKKYNASIFAMDMLYIKTYNHFNPRKIRRRKKIWQKDHKRQYTESCLICHICNGVCPHWQTTHLLMIYYKKSSRKNVCVFFFTLFWWSPEAGSCFSFIFSFSPRMELGQSSRSYQPTEADYKAKISLRSLI